MATILKGKFKGKEAKIQQWCNDWFSVVVEGQPKVVSPTLLQFTPEEFKKILAHKNNGMLLAWFEPTKELRFKRKKI